MKILKVLIWVLIIGVFYGSVPGVLAVIAIILGLLSKVWDTLLTIGGVLLAILVYVLIASYIRNRFFERD